MTERKTRHEATTPRLSRDSLYLAKEVRSIQHRAAEHVSIERHDARYPRHVVSPSLYGNPS